MALPSEAVWATAVAVALIAVALVVTVDRAYCRGTCSLPHFILSNTAACHAAALALFVCGHIAGDCSRVAVLTHYFVVAVFVWLAFLAKHHLSTALNATFAETAAPTAQYVVAGLVSYGVPASVVGVAVAVARDAAVHVSSDVCYAASGFGIPISAHLTTDIAVLAPPLVLMLAGVMWIATLLLRSRMVRYFCV